jgi:hypothetical protein
MTDTNTSTATQATENSTQEREYTFVIWDHCQWPNPVAKEEVKLRGSQPLSDLRKELCERFKYQDEWFQLNAVPNSGTKKKKN